MIAKTRKTTRMATRIAGKNLLFAELIVVILFFSLAAAACVSLFGDAYKDSNRSRDLTVAVITAQNAAECFKASGGDRELFLELLDGVAAWNIEVDYSDGTGQRLYRNYFSDVFHVRSLRIQLSETQTLFLADISVADVYELNVAIPKGVA